MSDRSDVPAPRIALLAGATGLVGRHCLDLLLDAPDVARVVAIVRRPPAFRHARLVARVVDFARLDELEGQIALRATDGFCALGTTIARAGTREAFRQVDYGYTLAFARLALRHGVRRFALVSSVGADASSRNFYLRTKGEVEDAVRRLPFETLAILRPGLLLGERDEARLLEGLARATAPVWNLLLASPLRRYRAVPASLVAAAMLGALPAFSGVRVLEFDDIERLARAVAARSARTAEPQA